MYHLGQLACIVAVVPDVPLSDGLALPLALEVCHHHEPPQRREVVRGTVLRFLRRRRPQRHHEPPPAVARVVGVVFRAVYDVIEHGRCCGTKSLRRKPSHELHFMIRMRSQGCS